MAETCSYWSFPPWDVGDPQRFGPSWALAEAGPLWGGLFNSLVAICTTNLQKTLDPFIPTTNTPRILIFF